VYVFRSLMTDMNSSIINFLIIITAGSVRKVRGNASWRTADQLAGWLLHGG
jgi:hypothetical protein